MKCVLLLHPTLQFYKIPVYNKLSQALRLRGVRLIVWYTDIKKEEEPVDFESLDIPMTMKNYRMALKKYEISAVINLLFKKTPSPKFYFSATLLAKWKRIQTIYYGHGFNLQALSQKEKIVGNLILLLFEQIVLYSPDQMALLWRTNRKKVSVAYNTLDMAGCRERVTRCREDIKSDLGVCEKQIILFSGRIQPRKRLDILVEMFRNTGTRPADTALVIIGPGIDPVAEKYLEQLTGVYVLGPIYDRKKMNEVFSVADMFCIPGAMGLGLVEALYWGLPVLSLEQQHGPEAYYLKDKENGFLLSSSEELVQKLIELSNDTDQVERLAENASRTFDEKASLKNMFEGFYQALGVGT